MRQYPLPILAGIAAWLFLGCAGSSKPVKTEGIVTLNGTPLDGAMVLFEPVEKGSRAANGRTGKDGVFHLTTFNTGDGALPGRYKVTITKSEATELNMQLDPKDPESMNKAYSKMKGMAGPPKTLKEKGKEKKKSGPIPSDYSDNAKTPLTYTIPHEGPITIEIKSSGG